MNIQNVFFGNTTMKNILGEKTSKISQEKNPTRVDSVKISATMPGFLIHADSVSYEISNEIEHEYPSRTELIRTVSERIAQGTYNDILLESVAQNIVDSPVMSDIVTEFAMDNVGNPDVRPEEVEKATDQMNNGYYDSPDILREIADRIITDLGLLRLMK